MTDEGRDAGFDDWVDAAEQGEAYALICPDGHGSLPPRRLCPDCGSESLERERLPDAGTLETFTVTEIPTPAFEDDAPYVVGIATVGSVSVTGQVIGIDHDAVETGLTVEIGIERSRTSGNRVVTLRVR